MSLINSYRSLMFHAKYLAVAIVCVSQSIAVLAQSGEAGLVAGPVILIERICEGACPFYRVGMDDHGRILWRGDRYVAVKGNSEFRGQASLVQPFVDKLFPGKKEGICISMTGYTERTVVLAYSRSNNLDDLWKRKKPRHIGACPPEIWDDLADLERAVNTHRWIHGTELITDERKVGEDAMAFNKPGFSRLMQAAALDNLPEVKERARGAELNNSDESGWTSLMVAASQCKSRVLQLLLERGASPGTADKQGETALMAMASSSCFLLGREDSAARLEMARLLVRSGVAVNTQDSKGRTALMIAAEHANSEATKMLLDAGAVVSMCDNDGLTPVMYAKKSQELIERQYDRTFWDEFQARYQTIIRDLSDAEKHAVTADSGCKVRVTSP